MNRTGTGVERGVAGRGRAYAHVGRPGVEKGVPIIGVDYGYLWSRAPEASDAPHDEVAGKDPARWSSNLVASALLKVQRGSVALWSSLFRQKGQSCRVDTRSCKLEAAHGWSCAADVSLRCWHM